MLTSVWTQRRARSKVRESSALGLTAALKPRQALANIRNVFAIEAVTATQGIDLRAPLKSPFVHRTNYISYDCPQHSVCPDLWTPLGGAPPAPRGARLHHCHTCCQILKIAGGCRQEQACIRVLVVDVKTVMIVYAFEDHPLPICRLLSARGPTRSH